MEIIYVFIICYFASLNVALGRTMNVSVFPNPAIIATDDTVTFELTLPHKYGRIEILKQEKPGLLKVFAILSTEASKVSKLWGTHLNKLHAKVQMKDGVSHLQIRWYPISLQDAGTFKFTMISKDSELMSKDIELKVVTHAMNVSVFPNPANITRDDFVTLELTLPHTYGRMEILKQEKSGINRVFALLIIKTNKVSKVWGTHLNKLQAKVQMKDGVSHLQVRWYPIGLEDAGTFKFRMVCEGSKSWSKDIELSVVV